MMHGQKIVKFCALFIIGINMGTNYSVIQDNEIIIITTVDSSVVLYSACGFNS
jgi:hypothetical protein